VRPRGRDLDRDELRAYVAALAARQDAWAPLVAHNPQTRIFRMLERDEHLETWVICWMAGHDTGFHDHDLSSGAVAIVRGAVREERLRLGAPPSSRIATAGTIFDFGATDIHRVAHHGTAPTVSVHAYSPPLRRMGAYVVGEGGTLARHPLAHDQELRALDSIPS
jgi:predicted metal-dependent enzyme (double-stranded beta helix superfamily)